MDEKIEEELEDQLVKKMRYRLDKIRKSLGVTFPYSTYDTNAILAEVGSEIRQARIAEERKDKQYAPTQPQMKLINDLRTQVGESTVDASGFKSFEQVDKEIKRLKEKRNSLERT
jgi:hypothetical protein